MARPFRFAPPRTPDGLVVKSSVLDRICQVSAYRLVTVVAGPGFGKTVLLSTALTKIVESGDRSGGCPASRTTRTVTT